MHQQSDCQPTVEEEIEDDQYDEEMDLDSKMEF